MEASFPIFRYSQVRGVVKIKRLTSDPKESGASTKDRERIIFEPQGLG